MLKKTIFDINALSPEKTAAAMSDALAGRRGYFEFTHRLSSGETRHVEVYSGSMVVKGKTLLHSIIHDVTDRKQLQEELIKARKMEAVGVLSGGIAHDFNNLLSVILGNLEMAKDDLGPSHPAMEVIEEAEAGGHRAKELIRTFLVLSGSTGKQRESLDVGETIRAAIDRAPLGGDTVCRFEPDPHLPPLWGDREGLLLAFRNILTNADEAMSGGGTIRIGARIVPGSGIPRIQTASPEGTWVRIDIEDEGVGIPEERLPRIFDAYYSTKERGSQKGMGLGLAVVQTIIQEHGGRVEAASTLEGAAFRVYLPTADSAGPEIRSGDSFHPSAAP
jgi:signal transduction histidine kinase